MSTRGTITLQDFDNEKTSVHVTLADIGFLGATYASESQNLDEIKDALDLIARGEIREVTLSKTFPESGAAVTNPEAQRETKWLITYKDVSQFSDAGSLIPNNGYLKLFTMEVGTADLSLLTNNSDKLDLTVAPGSTVKASLEANMRSPHGGLIQVVSIRHVGRNT